MEHDVKILPEFYDDSESGIKGFTIRRDDRIPKYAVGDILNKREFNGEYTGRSHEKRINYIYRGPIGLKKGYAILGFETNSN